jgi:hypothetical protein
VGPDSLEIETPPQPPAASPAFAWPAPARHSTQRCTFPRTRKLTRVVSSLNGAVGSTHAPPLTEQHMTKCGCAATSSSRGSSLAPPKRVCLAPLRVAYTTPSEPHCPAQVRPSRSRVIQSLLAAPDHAGPGTAFDTTFSIIDKDPTRNAEGHSVRHTPCPVPLTLQVDAHRTSIPARHLPPHGLTLTDGRAALGLSPPAGISGILGEFRAYPRAPVVKT